jgi:CheY-like chemotaxis protein
VQCCADVLKVLMDVQMPVLDGYDATREIRKHKDPNIRNVLVIAMTASAIQGDKEKCLDAGMNNYLAKPVRVATLKALLESYLEQTPKEMPNMQEEANTIAQQILKEAATRTEENKNLSSVDEYGEPKEVGATSSSKPPLTLLPSPMVSPPLTSTLSTSISPTNTLVKATPASPSRTRPPLMRMSTAERREQVKQQNGVTIIDDPTSPITADGKEKLWKDREERAN